MCFVNRFHCLWGDSSDHLLKAISDLYELSFNIDDRHGLLRRFQGCCILSSTHNHRREVAKPKAAAMAAWKQLDIVWKNAKCPPKFKFVVLDAVVCSKLVHGLDCINIQEAALNRLNTFQPKCIRKVLGIQTTFVNRANTNQAVFETATEVRYEEKTGRKTKVKS